MTFQASVQKGTLKKKSNQVDSHWNVKILKKDNVVLHRCWRFPDINSIYTSGKRYSFEIPKRRNQNLGLFKQRVYSRVVVQETAMRLSVLLVCIVAFQSLLYSSRAAQCEPGKVCEIVGGVAQASSVCSKDEDCKTGELCLGNGACGTVGTPYGNSDIVSGRVDIVGTASVGTMFSVSLAACVILVTMWCM